MNRKDEIKQFVTEFNDALGIYNDIPQRKMEIEKFKEEFNKDLEKAYETYYNNEKEKFEKEKEKIEKQKKRPKSSINPKKRNLKLEEEKKLEKPPAWKPTYGNNRYFEKFKKLNDEYVLSDWEKVRVPYLLPKTYEKTKNLPQKKDMLPQRKKGDYISEHLKENKKMLTLTSTGDDLINKFKKDNKKLTKKLKSNEGLLWEYRHSKPDVKFNKWKPFNHVQEYFSTYPIDIVYSFKKEIKKEPLVKEPFKVPKKDGDYFYKRPSSAINHFYVL